MTAQWGCASVSAPGLTAARAATTTCLAVIRNVLKHAIKHGMLTADSSRAIASGAEPKRDVCVGDDDYAAIATRLPAAWPRGVRNPSYPVSHRPSGVLGPRAFAAAGNDLRFTARKNGQDRVIEFEAAAGLDRTLRWFRP